MPTGLPFNATWLLLAGGVGVLEGDGEMQRAVAHAACERLCARASGRARLAARRARRDRADRRSAHFEELDDLLAADGIALTEGERARLEAPAGPPLMYPQRFLLEQCGIGDVPSVRRAR